MSMENALGDPVQELPPNLAAVAPELPPQPVSEETPQQPDVQAQFREAVEMHKAALADNAKMREELAYLKGRVEGSVKPQPTDHLPKTEREFRFAGLTLRSRLEFAQARARGGDPAAATDEQQISAALQELENQYRGFQTADKERAVAEAKRGVEFEQMLKREQIDPNSPEARVAAAAVNGGVPMDDLDKALLVTRRQLAAKAGANGLTSAEQMARTSVEASAGGRTEARPVPGAQKPSDQLKSSYLRFAQMRDTVDPLDPSAFSDAKLFGVVPSR